MAISYPIFRQTHLDVKKRVYRGVKYPGLVGICWDMISIHWTQVWTLRFRPGQHQNFDDCHLCCFACCQMSPRAEQKYQWHHHPPGVQGMSQRWGFEQFLVFDVFVNQIQDVLSKGSCFAVFHMGWQMPHIFPWNWPVAAAGSGKPVLEVRPEGMILVCEAPRTPRGSNRVHQFPSVWFPRVILVLCFLMLFASSCWWFLLASTVRCWDSLQDKLSAIAEVEGVAGACCGSGSGHSQSGEGGGPTKLGTSSTGTEWSGTAGATFCSGSDADRCNEVNYNLTKAGGRKWRCCDCAEVTLSISRP